VAVYYVQQNGTGHFNGPHEKMGLSIVCLASIQVLSGILRPPRPNSLNSHIKTPAGRTAFEICHRILGSSLLLCGLWQKYGRVCNYMTQSFRYHTNVSAGSLLGVGSIDISCYCLVCLSEVAKERKKEIEHRLGGMLLKNQSV
jgi:hypothetical protein